MCNFTLGKFCADNHRIKLEKILKIKSNYPSKLLSPSLNHTLSMTTTSLKYFQGWWLLHSPGQPFPMPNNPFREEIFPYIQSKSTLAKLEAFLCVLSLIYRYMSYLISYICWMQIIFVFFFFIWRIIFFFTKLNFTFAKRAFFPWENHLNEKFSNDADCFVPTYKFNIKYYYYKVSCYAY